MKPVNVVDGASGLDFPGSNPPAYVLKMTSTIDDGNNGWIVYGNQPTGVRNETVCSRTYQRFGATLPIAHDPNMRIKLHEAQIGGVLMQHEIQHYGQGNLGINYDCNQDGQVNIQQAGRSSWIRFESCYDVNTSSVNTRMRATVVDTGVSDTIACDAEVGLHARQLLALSDRQPPPAGPRRGRRRRLALRHACDPDARSAQPVVLARPGERARGRRWLAASSAAAAEPAARQAGPADLRALKRGGGSLELGPYPAIQGHRHGAEVPEVRVVEHREEGSGSQVRDGGSAERGRVEIDAASQLG